MTDRFLVPIGLIAVVLLALSVYSFTSNITGTALAAVAAVIAAIYVQHQTRRREIESRHFEKKVEGYSQFVDLFLDISYKTTLGKEHEITGDHIAKKFVALKKVTLMWGSVDMIRALEKFEKAPPDNSANTFIAGDEMIQCLRKDLGHNDITLKKGELILFHLKPGDEKDKFKNIIRSK